jgi:hypothetical protein
MQEYIQKNAKTIAALLVGVLATLLKQHLGLNVDPAIQDFVIVAVTAYAVNRFANKAILSTGEKVNVADIKKVVDEKVEQATELERTSPTVAPPWQKEPTSSKQ